MDADRKATSAAMKAWTDLGASGPMGGAGAERKYSDGRIILPAPTAEAGREVEERTRAREQRHAEGRARILRTMGGSLNLSHAVGLGPWASSRARSPLGREAEGGGEDNAEGHPG